MGFLGRFYIVILFWVVLSLDALAQSSSHTGVWNGHLNQTNVVECSNLSNQQTVVSLRLRDNDGELQRELSYVLGAHATRHTVLNGLNGYDIVNRYGTYEVISSTSPIYCHTAFYRLAAPNSVKPVEYAYSMPTVTELSGTTVGFMNSMNPSGEAAPVNNWLSLINLESTSFSATVKLFNLAGQEYAQFQTGSLNPGERRDFAVAHDQGQIVGMFQIIPQNQSQSYAAFSIRYGAYADGYRFAFPIQASNPSCDPGPVPASTMDPAINYGEVGNISNAPQQYRAEVRNQSGALLFEQIFELAPHAQRHFPIHEYLGERNVGSFRVRCVGSQSGGALVASMFYGLHSIEDRTLEWAYTSQALGRQIEALQLVATPINTFFGARNWNKFHERAGVSSMISLSLFNEQGNGVAGRQRPLPANGSFDYALHEHFLNDTIGLALSQTGQSDALFNSELLRVFYRTDGTIGYIMNLAGAVIGDGSTPPAGVNVAPQVEAGGNQEIALADEANLQGIVQDDGLPYDESLSVTWSKLSGPGTVVFADEHAAQTIASFSSAGQYVLRLAASDGELMASDTVMITVNTSTTRTINGWTLPFTSSGFIDIDAIVQSNRDAGGRIIYHDPSAAVDGDGSSPEHPTRSFILPRDGQPDVLLIKRGSVYTTGLNWTQSGPSPQHPVLIGSYGVGPRPKFITPHGVNGIRMTGGGGSPATRQNIIISGLEFYAETRDPGSPNFAGPHSASGFVFLRPGSNLMVEDCVFRFYAGGMVVQAEGSGLTNFILRRSVIVDSYGQEGSYHSQGLYTSTIHGMLIEDNIFDHNGWNDTVPGAGMTIFNHNLYLQSGDSNNVVVRNNISARASSHGAQVRPGGVVQNNLFVRNPISFFVAQSTSVAGDNVTLEANDIGSSFRGWGMEVINSADTHVFRNIFAHPLRQGSTAINVTSDSPRTTVEQNITFNWNGTSLRGNSTTISLNNEFNLPAGTYPDPNRSVGSYNATLGGTATLEAFLAEARQQSRTNWRAAYTASAVNSYIRDGFGR